MMRVLLRFVTIRYDLLLFVTNCGFLYCISCRFIVHLGRTIKSRKHPEKNLVNRYAFTFSIRPPNILKHQYTDSDDSNPLSAFSLQSSHLNKGAAVVIFPYFTRNKCRHMFKDLAAKDIMNNMFYPMLGNKVLTANRKNTNEFTCISTYSYVRIGAWRFQTGDEDDDSIEVGATNSYFSIRAKNIPVYHEYHTQHKHDGDDIYDGEELLIGQFTRFMQLTLTNWKPIIHHAGKCRLYRIHSHSISGSPIINMKEDDSRAQYYDIKMKCMRPVVFVPLQHVESMIAVAPRMAGWKDRTIESNKDKQQEIKQTDEWIAMPLQL